MTEQDKQGSFFENPAGADAPGRSLEGRHEDMGQEPGNWEGYSLSTLDVFFDHC